MKIIIPTACLALILSGSGCGTMLSHFGDCCSTPPPGVYRGTRFDAACIAAPFASEPHVELLPLGVLDMPFSLAADTIILPFDVADCSKRTKSKKEADEQTN